MTGLITNIKRMAVHDGIGLRTTVFFKGCPLRCIWCHNPDTLSFDKELVFYSNRCVGCGACAAVCPTDGIGVNYQVDSEKCIRCHACSEACPTGAKEICGTLWDSDTLAQKVLEDRAFFISSGGGVTLSGGECMCQIDFAEALAKRFYEEGISVNIDTCGYVRFENFQRIIPYTDTFLYDLKTISSDVHKRCTGRDNDLILDNLKRLDKLGCKVEIRYPYVPGWNDDECAKIGSFLAGLRNIRRIKVLGYHNFAASKYHALGMKNTLPAVTVRREDVQNAVNILTTYGLDAINGMAED